MDKLLEICANSIRSALAAQEGGADRIELCDNMAEGGTTPSYGTISLCKKLLRIPVFPIIRPRGGDFLYTSEEFEVMKEDVKMCRQLDCEGVVIGILHADGTIDKKRCAELITLARPMQVTFHRAFDRAENLMNAMEDIIELGCERILTSGGEEHALGGLQVIKELVQRACKRIIIMPGAGISEENISMIANKSGAKEFHSTARANLISSMMFRGSGILAEFDNNLTVQETITGKVKSMKETLL